MQQGFSMSGRMPWPAIGLASLAWLMSVAYGFQYLVMGDESTHLAYFRVATVPYAIIVVLLTWYSVRDRSTALHVLDFPAGLGLSMMTISWLLSCYFYSAQLAPLPWFVIATVVPFAATLANWKGEGRGAVSTFLVGGLALVSYLVWRLPHDVAGGDMLQIIDFAARDFLAGNNPFRPYLTVSGKEVLFGYWPGIWLPYVPVVALGLDMRVLNVVLMALLILLFWRASGGGERGARILSVVLLPVLLSSPFLQMVLSGHLWMYWLLAATTLLLIVRGRYTLAAIVFGLCLASRPTALFLVGPIVAYVWTRASARTAITGGVLALGVFFLLNAPFYFIYKESLVRASFGVLAGIGHVLTHFSLEGLLQAVGFGSMGKPLQIAAAVAAMAVIVVKRRLRPENFVVLAGVTYIWEILFASYATRYVYFAGFLLVALGLVLAQARCAERTERIERDARAGAAVSASA